MSVLAFTGSLASTRLPKAMMTAEPPPPAPVSTAVIPSTGAPNHNKEGNKTTASNQTSPFFTLPAELRNRIYHLVNSSPGGSSSSSASREIVPIDRLFTQPGYKLTQTSNQLRSESSPVFFSANTFKFYLCFPPPLWVWRVEEKFLGFIGTVVLEDYQSEGWHPTPVCQSRIEVDLGRLRDGEAVGGGGRSGGGQEVVVKRTDANCRECERRRYVRPAKLEGIVKGLVEMGEGGKQSPKLTREGLLAMFEAARWHYSNESWLAGIEERVIE